MIGNERGKDYEFRTFLVKTNNLTSTDDDDEKNIKFAG